MDATNSLGISTLTDATVSSSSGIATGQKVTIPRNSSGNRSWKPRSPKTRVLHACDPCRIRRAKCTGERPTCQTCMESKRTCSYSDKKRKREQQRTEELENRVKQCEDLLRQLEPFQDAATQASIHRILDGQEGIELFQGARQRTLPLTSPSHSGPASMSSRKNSYVSLASSDKPSLEFDDKSDRLLHRLLEDINTLSINQPTGFLGRMSDETWVTNIYTYLRGQARGQEGQSSVIADDEIVTTYYVDDQDISISGRQVDHLQLPPKWISDSLLHCYFMTMHDLIPIVEKQDFLARYNQLYQDGADPTKVPWGWLAILNVVFAIGQAHMDLKNDWSPDRSTHVEYFLRARILGALDGGLVFEAATLQDVQVMGLSAIYLLATKQVNRAWNAIGLAIRLAQGLGLHFATSASTLTSLQKELRLRVWYSLYYIDSTVCLATGRPPGITDLDCQAPIPRTIVEDERGTYLEYPRGDPCPYFLANHHLLLLIAEVTNHIYSGNNPNLGVDGWRKTRGVMDKLESKMDRWRSKLHPTLEFTSYQLNLANASQRMDLALFYYNARILILQPCVVPLITPHPNPSQDFLDFLATSQQHCIFYALEIIKLMLEEWDIDRRLSTIPWWCFLHYLGCAEAVIMSALLYGNIGDEGIPWDEGKTQAQGETTTTKTGGPGRERERELVAQCKLGIRWMREVSQRSLAGQRCCVRLSKCLMGIVRKIGLEEDEEIGPAEVKEVFAGPSDFLLRQAYE